MAKFPYFGTFKHQLLCIAVDHSSSTSGPIHRSERNVVHEICALRPFWRSFSPLTTLLPWNDQPHTAIDNSLGRHGVYTPASGTTVPSSIYANERYMKALRDCSVWFLFTDGEIHAKEINAFRDKTSKLGLYDTPCDVVVFGSAAAARPSAANISIGMSTSAVAPDSLFLFHDYPTDSVYLLQAKGCFEVLLPIGGNNPKIDKDLRWPQVHRIIYKDLANVMVPSPIVPFEADAMNLEGPATRQREKSESTIDQTSEPQYHPNATSSISMSEVHGENEAQVSNALAQHSNIHTLALPMRPKDVPETGHALAALKKVLHCLAVGCSEHELNTYRLQLNTAYRANIAIPQPATAKYVKPVKRIRTIDGTRSEMPQRQFAEESSTDFRASDNEDDDLDPARPFKIAKIATYSLGEGGENMMQVAVREAKNYAAATDQDVTASAVHSAGILGGEPDERFRHKGQKLDPFPINGPRVSQRTLDARLSLLSSPVEAQDLPRPFVSGSSVVEAQYSSAVSKVGGFDHPPRFEGKCDLCLHKDVLSLFMIANSATTASFASPSKKNRNVEFNKNSMAEIPLPDLFWDQACCSTCVSHLAAPGANLLPASIRSPNGEFQLGSGDVTKELWVAGLHDLCHGYVMRDQAEEFFHAVFHWKPNALAIPELKNSSFKIALLWMGDELQTGVKMIQTFIDGLNERLSGADYLTFGLYQTPRDRRVERARLDPIILD